MSELLLRGWNVAVPVVDVGDDVFIIDDRDKATRRVQVKTALVAVDERGRRGASFMLSRTQLRVDLPIELFYLLLMRDGLRWRYLVIPRADLLRLRSMNALARGAPRKPDDEAKTDALNLRVDLDGDSARAWGAPLDAYLDRWPEAIWMVEGAPGGATGAPREPPTGGGDRDP